MPQISRDGFRRIISIIVDEFYNKDYSSHGSPKIEAIKKLRDFIGPSYLGLKEAKDLIEAEFAFRSPRTDTVMELIDRLP